MWKMTFKLALKSKSCLAILLWVYCLSITCFSLVIRDYYNIVKLWTISHTLHFEYLIPYRKMCSFSACNKHSLKFLLIFPKPPLPNSRLRCSKISWLITGTSIECIIISLSWVCFMEWLNLTIHAHFYRFIFSIRTVLLNITYITWRNTWSILRTPKIRFIITFFWLGFCNTENTNLLDSLTIGLHLIEHTQVVTRICTYI